jgi:hypothetical protein
MVEPVRKTPGVDTGTSGSKIPEAVISGEKNVLHKFRSFNYLFTLAAIKASALTDPMSVRESSGQFIIAKSSGKTVDSINASQAAGNSKSLVDGFNSKENGSPGRFDLFINNVEIETLMAFSKTTNLTMATKISFEIFEPLSINGFMEALQVSAMAAGHKSYMGAPFVLKMEFLGYLDSESGPSTNAVSAGDQATRHFVLSITKVEVDMNETGTRYRCSAVAHNEIGYGEHNNIKQSMQIEGDTVGKALEYLMKSLNELSKNTAKGEQKESSDLIYDQYEILFPTKNADGTYNYGAKNKDIMFAAINENPKSPANFAFPAPQAGDAYSRTPINTPAQLRKFEASRLQDTSGTGSAAVNAKQASKNVITQTSITVQANQKIHDIIASVIRDSSFGKDILRKAPKEVIKDGMIEYVHVAIEVEMLKWNPRQLRYAHKYRYLVLPYKMHYSRIPMYQNLMGASELEKLKKLYVRRQYQYLYTGKNVDIRSFQLKFNNLFYQAYPAGLGNHIFSNPNISGSGVQRNAVELSPTDEAQSNSLKLPQTPRHADPSQSKIVKHGGNAGRRDYYTYDALVGTMHQAILDNTDMISCELEILGDPFFLCTGGIGNYRPKITNGMTQDGEAAYHANDVIIDIEFRNPEDINPATGLVKFNNAKVTFSGCFRVISVNSKFNDGMFTQRLKLVRIPGQPIETVNPADSADAPFFKTFDTPGSEQTATG